MVYLYQLAVRWSSTRLIRRRSCTPGDPATSTSADGCSGSPVEWCAGCNSSGTLQPCYSPAASLSYKSQPGQLRIQGSGGYPNPTQKTGSHTNHNLRPIIIKILKFHKALKLFLFSKKTQSFVLIIDMFMWKRFNSVEFGCFFLWSLNQGCGFMCACFQCNCTVAPRTLLTYRLTPTETSLRRPRRQNLQRKWKLTWGDLKPNILRLCVYDNVAIPWAARH